MPDVTIRAITSAPGFHWFGYYDKLQFDPSGRYILGMNVDFEHRSPRPDDLINIGMIDTSDDDRWIELGRTSAWCWQQGCMLQWIPGSDSEVIWNDREDGTFISRIIDIHSGASRSLPAAVYNIAPDGKNAIGTDFRRINHMRPGYGYAGIADPNFDALAPDDVGIYKIDLTNGKTELLISISQVAAIPNPHHDFDTARHYFNHLLFNTDGTRFIFLHRWRIDTVRFDSRMFTANTDGTDLHVVDDYGEMSHFIWRDAKTITAWSSRPSHGDAYYVYEDLTGKVDVIGKGTLELNGHISYLADSDWILNDTYPQSGGRSQDLYLYHVPTGRRVDLASLNAPEEYTGEWRCDLHPRSDPSGRYVTIDSAHGNSGRQIYLLDTSEIIAEPARSSNG